MAIDSTNTSASGVDRLLGTQRSYEAVFTDQKANDTLKASDFLNLMIAQMKNQDFLNPMDDTQFVTQMAQFSTMQQMTELAEYSKTNYAMSLVGKTVTAARFNVSGNLDTATGVVSRISLVGGEYILYIDGDSEKRYNLNQVMEIHSGASSDKTNETDGGNKTTDTGTSGGSQASWDTAGIGLQTGIPTMNSIVVMWDALSSDAELASQLKYSVYYSEEGPFNTLLLVKNGILSGQEEQTGIKVATVPGLDAGKTYYFNVVVKGPDGTEKVFAPISVTTPTSMTVPGETKPPGAGESKVPEEDELEIPEEDELGEVEEVDEVNEADEVDEVSLEPEDPASDEDGEIPEVDTSLVDELPENDAVELGEDTSIEDTALDDVSLEEEPI